MIRLTVLAVAFLIGGCAEHQFDRPIVYESYEQHSTHVAGLDHWEIRSRISIREGSKAEIARFYWQRLGEAHTMEIFGGFGSKRIRIQQSPSGAVLENSEGGKFVGRSIREVLAENTGWVLPVAEMMSWIVGLPYPEIDSENKWNENGHISSIKQSDWTVLLSRYKEFDDYVLPTRVRIFTENPSLSLLDPDRSSPDGDTEIRLVISSWGVN